MNKYIVLGGAGAMGQVIVRDLADYTDGQDQVVIADFSEDNANKLKDKLGNPKVSAVFADLKDAPRLAGLLKDATCVINSTPYAYNIEVMEAALTAGCHYMDLGGLFHVTKKQLELNDRFKEKNLLAVLGMGAAPGMTNIMAAEAAHEFDSVESIDIAVGSVDFVAIKHPLPAPYALDTILDEYTAQPMVFENGQYLAEEPMSGEILIDFPKPVGKLSAILTLHSEVLTLPTSYKGKGVKRVTFRLGLPTNLHERFQLLCTIGFGSKEPVELNGSSFVPRFALAKLLSNFPLPDFVADDCEVVRVDVRGTGQNEERLVRMESVIYADKKWNVSCGALDTGVPPSIVAQLIGAGKLAERGVLPPELCVPRQEFFAQLKRRNIIVNKTAIGQEAKRAPV